MNELKQGSSEWLELRKQYVTATDAPIIMGLSPWCTAFKRWRQKMDLDPPDEETEIMQRGTLLEPLAREWFINETGIQCDPEVIFSGFMMASLDGISNDKRTLIEIKCGSKSFEQAEAGEISPMYLCQMNHQMFCAGVDQSLYVAFNGERGIIIPVERDQEFIDNMIPKLREFYECLLQYTPPMMTTKDYHQRSDDSWNLLAESYRNAYLAKKDAELLEETLKKELISLSGGLASQGAHIKLSQVVRRAPINYSSVPEILGLDLEKYRGKPIEYWKIMVD